MSFELEHGGWNFSYSHGTLSPSCKKQVEEQVPKLVGWTLCFLLMILIHFMLMYFVSWMHN